MFSLFHFSEVDDSMMSKLEWRENISTQSLSYHSYAIASVDRGFAVENSGMSYLTLIFRLSNPIMIILYAKKSV